MNDDPSVPAPETWTAGQISDADFLDACVLHHAAFPKPGRTLEQVIAKKRPVWMDPARVRDGEPDVAADPPSVRYVLREPGPDGELRCIANAAALVRTVQTQDGLMTVSGLLDVATHPDVRGRGLGAVVVQRVFAAVDDGTYPFCLFATGPARPFYEKLGAAVVTNRIVNSHADDDPEANPFTDDFVMRYPANTTGRARWPEGLIDLRGPGF